MKDLIRTNAKAGAALLAPIILAAVSALLEAAGIDVAFDPTVAESTVVALVSSIVVWLTTNNSSTPTPPKEG
jgi:hypothetical protein